jgi:hypothetical protein
MTENQILGLAIHVSIGVVFVAMSLRSRLPIRIAYLVIAAVNVGGIARLFYPEHAGQIELIGLYVLFIPLSICVYVVLAPLPKKTPETS